MLENVKKWVSRIVALKKKKKLRSVGPWSKLREVLWVVGSTAAMQLVEKMVV